MPLTQAISYAWIHRWLAKYAELGMMDFANDVRTAERNAILIANARLSSAGTASDPALDCLAYVKELGQG